MYSYGRVWAMMSTLLRMKETHPPASVLASRSCSSRPYDDDVPRSPLSTELTVWHSCWPACVYATRTTLDLVAHLWTTSQHPSIETTCIVCDRAGSMQRYGVRPSVCPSYQPLLQRAAGLLLWTRRHEISTDCCTAGAQQSSTAVSSKG